MFDPFIDCCRGSIPPYYCSHKTRVCYQSTLHIKMVVGVFTLEVCVAACHCDARRRTVQTLHTVASTPQLFHFNADVCQTFTGTQNLQLCQSNSRAQTVVIRVWWPIGSATNLPNEAMTRRSASLTLSRTCQSLLLEMQK